MAGVTGPLNIPKIKQQLRAMNVTVEDFKHRIKGINSRTVERLLSGETQSPHPDTIASIAAFLKLAPTDIVVMHADGPASGRARRLRPAIGGRLPITGAYLVSRAASLAQLDQAWDQPDARIVTIVGLGGIGKSTLVNHWLSTFTHANRRGAECIFAWTFHNLEARDPVASAEAFLRAALQYFGDRRPGAGTPSDKGARLARFIRERRALLLLDGLEPLQHLLGPDAGRLQDAGLAEFLPSLASHNPGLCVITTRLAVADLTPFGSSAVKIVPVEALSEEAGAEFLGLLGVQGSDTERRAASREFGGHTLALNLLGTYLFDACGGDVNRRREVALWDDWSEEGGQVWRIMDSYERRFGNGPEVPILRLLGLFDRRASAAEVAALRAGPIIPGLNEALLDISEQQWRHALRRLCQAGLLLRPDHKTPHVLDAHPLVREYYRHQLRAHHPAAWRAGHARLYAYCQQAITEPGPTGTETLWPLHAAVTHGCLAGLVEEACELFQQRLQVADHHSIIEQPRAFGADVSTLSNFFEVMWSRVAPGLPSDHHLALFSRVGECLSALGRVFEAVEPLEIALKLALGQNDWTRAAMIALILSEVYRARGDLMTALDFVQHSVQYADRPGVPLQVAVRSHACLGFAQHWIGQSEAVRVSFQRAECLQKQATPERRQLHSVPGYMYSEVLLDDLESQQRHLTPQEFTQQWDALRARVEQTLVCATQDGLPRDMGLQHVSMGRVYILAWEAYSAEDRSGGLVSLAPSDAPCSGLLEQARLHLTTAVDHLRASDQRNYLPRGLLTRARLYRLQGHFALAHGDVNEAVDIARNGPMEFYQADAYLEQAALYLASYRLSHRQDDVHQAARSLQEARSKIKTMDYHRRDHQVAALAAMLQEGADAEARG
jgi:tetratricopeptide (TPR) repeat protein